MNQSQSHQRFPKQLVFLFPKTPKPRKFNLSN